MSPQTAETTLRECPYCKEMIKADAIKCRYCESFLTPELPDHGGVCPFCKEEIKKDAIKCKYCKSDLTSAALIGIGGGGVSALPCGPTRSFSAFARQAGEEGSPCSDCILDCFLKHPDDDAANRRCLRVNCGGGWGQPGKFEGVIQLLSLLARAKL